MLNICDKSITYGIAIDLPFNLNVAKCDNF